MRLFLKVIDGIQPDTKRSATGSDCSHEILTTESDQEEMVGKLHTEIKGTGEWQMLILVT